MSSERHLPPIRVRDDPGAENPPRSAPYREPVELACFSKSRDAGVTYDSSMLKAYARPSVPFDLSEGFDTFRDRDRDVPRPADLAPIFGALRFKGAEDKELAAADVVTWRGNFAKLLSTPWNARDPWHMECEAVHDVLVLNVLEPEESLAKERKRTSDPARAREKRMCYWGFAFEEACTGGFRPNKAVDCADAFCAVVRAGVGRHRLVLGGEVDCWDGEKAGLPGYVELKTTRVMDAHAQVARFERDKLLKWWAQSFAVGVRRILVGFRDDDGHVRKLQTLDTLKLPGYAARHAGAWDPKTALAFADRVLTELKELFAGGAVAPGARVRLEYEPRRSREEVRVVADERIPDFIPAEARRALARAAAIRAAGGGATSSGSRGGARSGSLSKSRGSGGGGSVGGGSGGGGSVGGGSVGGGSVGGPASGRASGGTAASAKRGVVFRAPDPKQPGYDPARHSLRGASGSGTGSGGSGWNETKKESPRGSLLSGDAAADSSLSKRGVRVDEKNAYATRHDFENAYDAHRSKPISRANELEDTVASADAFGNGGPGSTPARLPGVSRETVPEGAGERTNAASPPASGSPVRSPEIDPPAPTARFVHWGVGGSIDERHERRRRRRHERSQTPVPGGAALRESRAKDPMAAGAGGGATPPHSTAPSRADHRASDDARRASGDRGTMAAEGLVNKAAQPAPHAGPHASSGGRFAGGHKGGAHHSFRHPVVAGPGVGDPFKLAASKLAYARALGPAAMSFLMGFTPGDPGWRGDDAETLAAAGAAAAGEVGGRGEEARAAARASADTRADVPGDVPGDVGAPDEAGRELDAGTPPGSSPKKGSVSSRTEPGTESARHPPDPPPDPVVVASAEEKKSVGLDPRAFAFDPLNPGASLTARAMVQTATRADADADAAEPLDVSGGSALSGDGPQGSYVGAAAVSGKKRDGAARLRADAFNADAAGSDVEDAEAAVKRTRRG